MFRFITMFLIVFSLLSNFTFCSKSKKNDDKITLARVALLGQSAPSMGILEGWIDVHGAGAQRSDPKSGNPADYPKGRGPQGDAIRIYNYVRLVRGNSTGAYTIVDTSQTKSFNATAEITAPTSGQDFYGQDAQFSGTQPSYTKSADGLTIKDNITGLTWQKSPDTNSDGTINASDKLTLTNAQARTATLNAANHGGYNDWRLPTIKELYSLMNFNGTDVGPNADITTLIPFIDRTYFNFAYGDTTAGERILDSQYASSNTYVSKIPVLGDMKLLFGVNFADGRIKGYGLTMPGIGTEKIFFVQCVRGTTYGTNNFADNVDLTISDKATGLMWSKADSTKGLNWQEALAWVQTKNAENYLGHNDWRLPNAKELQSIVDYSRSPDTTSSAAINALFTSTSITNEAGQVDYPFYWTSTTHMSSTGVHAAAVYLAFGRAMGYMVAPSGPPPM